MKAPKLKPTRLTQAMVDTLERIDELKRRHGACGMFPSGAGGWKNMRALEARGLVRWVGDGVDIDSIGREVSIYDMTNAGAAELERIRRPSKTARGRRG